MGAAASLTARKGFASVALVMVLVQHILTRCYLQGLASWTAELDEAWAFADVAEAMSFCRMGGVNDVEILAVTSHDVRRIQMPDRGAGALCPLPGGIPIVLPRTDMRPD